MKKLNNKKGFTIVELVIVIAVIGILAGVLIPTFSSITSSANESSALQQAENGLKSVLTLAEGTLPEGSAFIIGNKEDGVKYAYSYEGSKLVAVEDLTTTFVYESGEGNDKYYNVYVAEKALDKTISNNTTTVKLKVGAVAIINKLLGETGTVAELDISSGNSTKYYTATVKEKTLHIYYTNDFSYDKSDNTMVAFIGVKPTANDNDNN